MEGEHHSTTREDAVHEGRRVVLREREPYLKRRWTLFINEGGRMTFINEGWQGGPLMEGCQLSMRENAVHRGREDVVHWGREPFNEGGRNCLSRSRSLREGAILQEREPFFERGSCSSREGAILQGREPFFKGGSHLEGAILQGSEGAVHQGRDTDLQTTWERTPFIEGGKHRLSTSEGEHCSSNGRAVLQEKMPFIEGRSREESFSNGGSCSSAEGGQGGRHLSTREGGHCSSRKGGRSLTRDGRRRSLRERGRCSSTREGGQCSSSEGWCHLSREGVRRLPRKGHSSSTREEGCCKSTREEAARWEKVGQGGGKEEQWISALGNSKFNISSHMMSEFQRTLDELRLTTWTCSLACHCSFRNSMAFEVGICTCR